MVDFAGFEMPIHYGSILQEHRAVRERAGLFDVSHMGQIHFSGPRASEALERLLTCPVASLRVGRARYGLLCNEEGGVVDDVMLYRNTADDFFLCVNASNIDKDYRWAVRHAPADTAVRDRSAETGMLALQGPEASTILAGVCQPELPKLRRFAFVERDVAGAPAKISRTGYTGSPGFELYLRAADLVAVFEAIIDAGKGRGLVPAGLGARDTLRLEAALPLYGHELDDATSPLEARLDRFVKREAGGFLGAEAIERRAAAGHTKLLVGLELRGRGIPREGYPIVYEGAKVGRVTSGAPSPTLGKSIGLGYVRPAFGEKGTLLDVMIRGRGVAARVVETPFVRAGHPEPPT